jgi:hypothetical protein
MKKRKKPIFLVAMLVLLVCVVAAMNTSLLTMPTTAKELEEQAYQEAIDRGEIEASTPATQTAAAPPEKPQGALVRPADEVDDLASGTNIKPRTAIADTDSRIKAPEIRKGQNRSRDRASVQAHSGWYMDESGAGKK